jgi:hypothetical protein
MNTAICFKCGEMKADPLSPCPQCGAEPRIELAPLKPRTTGGMLALAAGIATIALAIALAAHWS